MLLQAADEGRYNVDRFVMRPYDDGPIIQAMTVKDCLYRSLSSRMESPLFVRCTLYVKAGLTYRDLLDAAAAVARSNHLSIPDETRRPEYAWVHGYFDVVRKTSKGPRCIGKAKWDLYVRGKYLAPRLP